MILNRAIRYHDISCGHRVVGHENKCASLHGHNYRIHFECAGDLDAVGRVIDFSVIKSKLCVWLEERWDHCFLAWEQDPLIRAMSRVLDEFALSELPDAGMGIVLVPFNPTAENMARFLLEVVGPAQLAGTGVLLESVLVEETRKCSALATRE